MVKASRSRGSEEGKRDVAGPSGVWDTAVGVGLAVARKYLFVSAPRRAVAYATAVVVASLLGEFLVPKGHLPPWAQKNTLLNQYFVKLGWGWTFTVTGTFVVLTSLVYSAEDWGLVRQQLARLLVATGLWYTLTWAFVKVETATGLCTVETEGGANRWSCPRAGGQWLGGFDISGHCFLLIYASLVMTEEGRVFGGWEALRRLLHDPDEPVQLAGVGAAAVGRARKLYHDLSPAIHALFIAMAALSFLWDVSLVITAVWHHTIGHKLAGSAFALLCWQLTYRLWFTLPASPGTPGRHAPIRYQAYRSATAQAK